jgi:hypothetical protein
MPILITTLGGWGLGGLQFEANPRQIVIKKPSPNTIRAKWTGGVDPAVECLLRQAQALNSNPSLIKRKLQLICINNLIFKKRTQHGGWTLVIPALRGMRQEDLEFEASLSYIVSSRLSRTDGLCTQLWNLSCQTGCEQRLCKCLPSGPPLSGCIGVLRLQCE